MILIADSGSTKTDWRLINEDGTTQNVKTVGFNPRYQDTEDIFRELHLNLVPGINSPVDEVYFYGAGCSSEKAVKIVSGALQQAFPAATINVEEDTLGAARSLCGHEQGIVCILGTGSNSCLFDGKKIVDSMPNLGFILGDEGSAGYMGKLLVRDFLYKEMPRHLLIKFDEKYKVTRKDVLDNVYNNQFPNRYLASFTKFLSDHIEESYCFKMVYRSFSEFFDTTICKYDNFQGYNVHFVGSIAYYFTNILKQVASDKGVKVKNILETPISGLTKYHQEVLKKA